MTWKAARSTKPASVEGLPADWRQQAEALRRYGGDIPATAIERCADDLEATLVDKDETIFSLVEAARESGCSADHLGRLVRTAGSPTPDGPARPGSR